MDSQDNQKLIRPKDLQAQYNIGQSTFYKRLRYLGIKAQKDPQRKAYLTDEQVTQFAQLQSHIQTHGTMIGFKTSQLVDQNTNPSQDFRQPIELKQETQNNIINSPKAPSPTAIAA